MSHAHPPKARQHTEEEFIAFQLAYGSDYSPLSCEPADLCAMLKINITKGKKDALVQILHFVGQYREWRQKQYEPQHVTEHKLKLEDIVEEAYGKVVTEHLEQDPNRPFTDLLRLSK